MPYGLLNIPYGMLFEILKIKYCSKLLVVVIDLPYYYFICNPLQDLQRINNDYEKITEKSRIK